MDSERLLEQCRQAAGADLAAAADSDALIGFFQCLRPDGTGLADAFQGLAAAEALQERLTRLYRDSGDDRRPQGGRDAYFIVRHPASIGPEAAEANAHQWLENLRQLAVIAGRQRAIDALSPTVAVRVLEGIPPKHPKALAEKSELLKVFLDELPELAARVGADSPAIALLRPAYYFIACDFALRDYLMWPLYQPAPAPNDSALRDPFEPYYTLWRHGVKYRIFSDDRIDLYLPRSRRAG